MKTYLYTIQKLKKDGSKFYGKIHATNNIKKTFCNINLKNNNFNVVGIVKNIDNAEVTCKKCLMEINK
jgi:hypothetical protein